MLKGYLNGFKGYDFELKYKNKTGVDLKLFWKMYELSYSPSFQDREEYLQLLKSFQYQDDIEMFQAFKQDADKTVGTLGYNFALMKSQHDELEHLEKKSEDLRADIAAIKQQEKVLVNNYVKKQSENLANYFDPCRITPMRKNKKVTNFF